MANNRGFDEHDMVRQHESKAHKLRNAVVTLMERKGMVGHVVKGPTTFEDHDDDATLELFLVFLGRR